MSSPAGSCQPLFCCPPECVDQQRCSLFDMVIAATSFSPASTPSGTTCCPGPNQMRSPRVIEENCAKYGHTCQESIWPSWSGYCC